MKLSLFFQILQNSVTSIKKYNHLLLLKDRIIFYYFIIWVVVLSFLQAIYFSLTIMPQLFAGLSQSLSEAVEYYPADLVLYWNGSDRLESNYDTIPLYYPSGFDAEQYSLPPNFGTYVSEEDPTLDEYNKYFLLATPNKLYVQEVTEQWDTFEYSLLLGNISETEFTKQTAEDLHTDWLNQKESLQQLVQVTALGVKTITGVISKSVTLLLRALFVLLIARYLARIHTDYKKTLKLAALFTVPSLIVETTIIYLYGADTYGLSGFTFWLLFTLYIWFGKVTIMRIKK